MNANDPNIAAVELVAIALGALREELVLVGGCSVGLLITDHARPPARQTVDVDLVAEVTSTTAFYALCEKLRQCGFSERADAGHMCRWHKGSLILDVMPSDESVLGHSSNRWYSEAVRSAMRTRLPRGTDMLVVSPPLFLATKLEAFYGRGGGDFGHHDMEDIINVIDGRAELLDEVDHAAANVREYLREEFDDLLADSSFVDGIGMHLRPDAVSQARVQRIIGSIRRLAGL